MDDDLKPHPQRPDLAKVLAELRKRAFAQRKAQVATLLPPDAVPLREAAAITGMSYEGLRQACQRGQLTKHYVRTRVWVSISEVLTPRPMSEGRRANGRRTIAHARAVWQAQRKAKLAGSPAA